MRKQPRHKSSSQLQRRGLFRRDYEGTTLREHLGLPRPQNRFFPDWVHLSQAKSIASKELPDIE